MAMLQHLDTAGKHLEFLSEKLENILQPVDTLCLQLQTSR
jgi:hypothetical protein